MYLWFKLLHLFAVTIFLGNIITGIFWKRHADRTGDPRLMAFAVDGIIRADRVFTMPSVTLLLLFGFGAAGVQRLPVFSTPWLLWSLVLFGLSAILFMGVLVPTQKKLRAIAQAARPGEPWDRAAYDALSRRWNVVGLLATLLPLLAFYLMVLKPAP